MPSFVNVGPEPDTDADVAHAVDNWQHKRISTTEFMRTINGIDLERYRWERRKREHEMTVAEYNEYYEGYGDDEFLVRRRW